MATACSGTDAPVVAMRVAREALRRHGVDFAFEHVMSAPQCATPHAPSGLRAQRGRGESGGNTQTRARICQLQLAGSGVVHAIAYTPFSRAAPWRRL